MLNKQRATELEDGLAKNPGDIIARAKLLGFYFSTRIPGRSVEERIRGRRAQILWLIANQPGSPLFWQSESTIDPRGHTLADAEGYQQARQLWLKQTAKKDVSAATLGCAGKFFYLPDKQLAADYFRRAHELDPDFRLWTIMRASTLVFAVVGITTMTENGLPGPADPAEAKSDFAKSALQQLQTSTDADLLADAANELIGRGHMAQTMTPIKLQVDALSLAEQLLHRAQKLAPSNDYSILLARVYELRARWAKSDEEKKSLARSRYEQLEKSASSLSIDDPANWHAFLDLAQSSFDAG
jgi:tetratricopeptide (TPR) repeat protein